MKNIDSSDWLNQWSDAYERGLRFFDFLTAIDWVDELEVVAHAVNPDSKEHEFMCTRIPADAARIASLSAIYGGAAWHERESAEMFGMTFDGLADDRRLLLRTGVGAAPLRHSTVLGARAVQAWPGIAEPGGSPARRRQRPPGIPDGWLEADE